MRLLRARLVVLMRRELRTSAAALSAMDYVLPGTRSLRSRVSPHWRRRVPGVL